MARIRIGIDVGGTFTDFVVYDPTAGKLQTFKLLSTPADPSEAVLDGLSLAGVFGLPNAVEIVHGSTVATNALLERKGARTALVMTKGFRDVLEIGRQTRPSLYDLFSAPPTPLVPAELRFEVAERVTSTGEVLHHLDPAELPQLVGHLKAAGADSVAVCLLFSFLHPEHERQIAGVLREAGFSVSVSSEILPEYREYERASTTTVNAYVSPVLDRYLARFEEALKQPGQPETQLRIMQSNGGHISPAEARRSGVRCILSGPAGGVIGAQYTGQIAEHTGPLRLVTFDMGGTSTDVSLIEGTPQVTSESIVGGCPIRVPVIDIHTIGAGGGSIASVDLGGALRVGPLSAGADPGPACYGRGSQPTVTDANLVLGLIDPQTFLDGQMPLYPEKALEAITALGRSLGLNPYETARGIIEVVNAHMERAIRLISVERGHDPYDYTLLSFGGAGGLHAADLARRVGIPTLLISPLASTLSAFGMLAAEVVKDYTQTVMLPGDTAPEAIAQAMAPLLERAGCEMVQEGIHPSETRLEPALDMRYAGQSYELAVAWPHMDEPPLQAFHQAHRQAYGYNQPAAQVEIVNLRLRAAGFVSPPPLPAIPEAGEDPSPALTGCKAVFLSRLGAHPEWVQVPTYRYERLQPGNRFSGPAVVIRSDTTVLVGPTDQVRVDGFQNLHITVGRLNEDARPVQHS